jgi:predicted O-methyltransferase YrrM
VARLVERYTVDAMNDEEAIGPIARARRGIDHYGWQEFVKEATLRPLRPALAPVAAYRLHRRAERVDGIEPLLDLAFDFDAFGITVRPGQVRCEFRQLLEQVAELRPRTVLEIGTANGGSLLAFAKLSDPTAKIISVDLPQGEFGGGYPRWKIPLYRAFAGPTQQLELVRGDSHDQATLARVNSLLAGAALDLLFIDGDHTYEGVRQDFETYGPLVRPGGLIGFHDIAWPDERVAALAEARRVTYLVGEVPRFWGEIRESHGGEEFVDGSGRGMGIGLIRV